MAPEVTVLQANTPELQREHHALRWRVFVDEQGVPADMEVDALDATACRAVATVAGLVVGAGRVVVLPGGEARIGRMSVDAAHRRQGVGGQVLRFLERAAVAQGAHEAALHAQSHTAAFYRRHGYREEGEPFVEAGIDHILMRKSLRADA